VTGPLPSSASGGEGFPAAAPVTRTAWLALALLFGVNFLNYIDRQIIFAVQILIQQDFHLTDAQLGTLGSAFMVVYMLASPITGFLADRWPRQWLVSAGVGLWSLATGAAGLAGNYWHLMTARAAVGIGEAGYATVSPGLLSDLFPPAMRGRIMSIFYMATPVGSALGIVLGGYLGEHYGWRTAFLAVGLPGLLVALAALWLPDPPRGALDGGANRVTARPGLSDYRRLLRIPSFLINTAGMAAYTFSMGGLIAWMPTYFVRERGLRLDEATFKFGAISVAAGVLGTVAGGWLGDRLQRKIPGAYFLLSGCGLALGVPCAITSVAVTDPTISWSFLFLAEFFLFLNTGPLNAALINVVPAEMRGTAFAFNIFFIHLLGDVPSPPLIGLLSDHFGLARAVIVAALPMGLGSIIYFAGQQTYARDLARIRAQAAGPEPGGQPPESAPSSSDVQ
jgi:MFS family permease